MEIKEHTPHLRRDENREGMEALAKSLRLGFLWIYILVIAMIIIVAAQSFVIVKQHEKAVIFRFGDVRKITGTGLHLTFPYPIEQTEIYEVTRTRQLDSSSFMFKPGAPDEAVPPVLKPGVDGYVLSADMNILHLKCTMTYLVDPQSDQAILDYFVFNLDTSETLRKIFDNAIIKAAANLKTDEILVNPEKLRTKIASELRSGLEKSTAKILFETRDISIIVSPPRQTKAAFDLLTQASQNQETLANDAESYKISSEREAQSAKDSIIAEAQSEGQRKIFAAKAESETFAQRVRQYEKNPELVARTIYEDSIYRIMNGVEEKFLVENPDKKQLRLLLGRNPELRKKQPGEK